MNFGSDNIMAKLARMRHVLGLAKIPATIDYIEEFFEDTVDKKLCVFLHHVDVAQIMLEKLKAKFEPEGIKVLALSSDLNSQKRYEIQEEFNKTTRVILIASTLAAGEGINLQTCSDAVLMERQWNPANEDQAAPGRFKRIGQLASHINITCITGQATIDDYLHAIVERKRRHFHKAMNKDNREVAQWNVQDIMKELGEAIVKGYNEKHGK